METISKDEAKSLYAKLRVRAKFLKTNTTPPKIDVMESIDQDGIPLECVSLGHVDFNDLADACIYYFSWRPSKVVHKFHNESWIAPRNEAEGTKSYCTTKLCDAYAKEAKPITIGYP